MINPARHLDELPGRTSGSIKMIHLFPSEGRWMCPDIDQFFDSVEDFKERIDSILKGFPQEEILPYSPPAVWMQIIDLHIQERYALPITNAFGNPIQLMILG